jgi:hypothetical protein
MRGEFIGVWSETWREVLQPLIDEPVGEQDEGLPEDVFCDLYRELAKALKRPTDSAAMTLLLGDAIALREAFDGAAQRARPDLAYELVKEAFETSGAESAAKPEQRRALLDAALLRLLGTPGAPLLEALLDEHARDATKIESAWNRSVERTINDTQASREAFEHARAQDIAGERGLVAFFEAVHEVLGEFETSGDDALTNHYFNLLAAFIEKFSLRYDLRRPCILCPTLPGLFASLVRDLRAMTSADQHLDALMKDFENAVRDLRQDCSDGRIKTCIQKQVNLLEAIGGAYPGVTEGELGRMCNQINSWPHGAVKAALKNLYGFASDYPGIRHGGTPASALRAVDMRDMVAMSILLAGFTPYLSNGLNPDLVYRGT